MSEIVYIKLDFFAFKNLFCVCCRWLARSCLLSKVTIEMNAFEFFSMYTFVFIALENLLSNIYANTTPAPDSH